MTSTQTAALVAEIERLTECLRYEQHRAGRRGTHGTDCYKWGPEHYECAMRQVERLTRELAEAKQDAERLRWLEIRLFSAQWNGVISSGSVIYWRLAGDYRHTVAAMIGGDFRAAIDAARQHTDAGATSPTTQS